jgi:hypothetical protein
MDFLPGATIIYLNGCYGCLFSMQFFNRDNKTLEAICPINVTPVPIGLLLKVFELFNEDITADKLADVLNRGQVSRGKE